MNETSLRLEQKIARIRQELKHMEKRGKNNFHHYDYVMAADVAADMGKLLADAGIVICRRNLAVTWVELGDQSEARLTCTYVLRDADSGAELEFASAGAGRDRGDKAIYKAHTGAFKYFFIQAFAMPIGDDPEAEAQNEQSAPPIVEKSQKAIADVQAVFPQAKLVNKPEEASASEEQRKTLVKMARRVMGGTAEGNAWLQQAGVTKALSLDMFKHLMKQLMDTESAMAKNVKSFEQDPDIKF